MNIEQASQDILVSAYKNAKDLYEKLHVLMVKESIITEELTLPPVIISANPQFVIGLVENEFDCSVSQKTRLRKIMEAKHCVAYLLRKYTPLTLAEICTPLCVTDHSTIIKSITTCKDWMEFDSKYKARVGRVENALVIKISADEKYLNHA